MCRKPFKQCLSVRQRISLVASTFPFILLVKSAVQSAGDIERNRFFSTNEVQENSRLGF